MKAVVVPIVTGALGAVTPKLEWWLQQIPGTTTEISVQKSTLLGTAKILGQALRRQHCTAGREIYASQ